ncbi:MAG: spiro-SPASM protein [Treponema sp.]|jgi:spiro-SPASM protein|nr:spiro-SPASM protein [Treponema sp.]
MNSLTVLYGMELADEAFEAVLGGKSAFDLALERASAFPGTGKRLLLAPAALSVPDGWTALSLADKSAAELLKTLSEQSDGFDLTYFAWADAPFLDAALTGKLADRHLRYHADYSYADGWPYGLTPELLAPGVAGILCKIAAADGEKPVTRETIFNILQKDINSFDIETELSPVDLRYQRLSLVADSKRNLLVCTRFAKDGGDAVQISVERPEYLRTLPAFFPIQVSGLCPKTPAKAACALCPYDAGNRGAEHTIPAGVFMETEAFTGLLDRIGDFAGGAVIDLSLWGEAALHPRIADLAAAVLERPKLALVIETSGYGWKAADLESIAASAARQARRENLPPVSWIVSLASADLPEAERESAALVKKLCGLFAAGGGEKTVHVQAIRTRGDEDAVENFYRAWKKFAAETPLGIIIQKYDAFCGLLPDKAAADLSPVKRRPCWHIMRDFPVLLDGTAPACREDIGTKMPVLGNAFSDEFETIWRRGTALYEQHCLGSYPDLCAKCDEYYTFNF